MNCCLAFGTNGISVFVDYLVHLLKSDHVVVVLILDRNFVSPGFAKYQIVMGRSRYSRVLSNDETNVRNRWTRIWIGMYGANVDVDANVFVLPFHPLNVCLFMVCLFMVCLRYFQMNLNKMGELLRMERILGGRRSTRMIVSIYRVSLSFVDLYV